MILMTNRPLAPVCVPSVIDKSVSSVVLEPSPWLPSGLSPAVPLRSSFPRRQRAAEAPRLAPLPVPSQKLTSTSAAASLSLEREIFFQALPPSIIIKWLHLAWS